MIKDFVIPMNRDELLQRSKNGEYVVENIIPLRMIPQAINDTRDALQQEGANFILDHFDTYFAVIVNETKIELHVCMQAFSKILKAIESLVQDMETRFDNREDLDERDKRKLLNVNKMLAYLFSCFVCHIDPEIYKNVVNKPVGKGKKTTKSGVQEEWEATREKALEYVYRWFQLPLHRLWQPSIVEDSFVMTITKVCYKVLEDCSKDTKMKHLRQTIFEILGMAIKKYNQGMSCVIRIIQLIKLNDILAVQIAHGVVHMITDCGCTGLLKEVIKEIDEGQPSETDSRYISVFLETISTSAPDLIIPNLGGILDYLVNEHYTLRNCAIGIIGIVVQTSLKGENLTEEQKVQRDECLNSLEDHLLDVNSYVRSKVLQVWQRLCSERAIPLARQGKLLADTAFRLQDKSTNVRKQALQLLRGLIQSNPYAAKLSKHEISKTLETEELKLIQLQTDSVSKSVRGDNQRLELWNTLLPDIRIAIKKFLNDLQEIEYAKLEKAIVEESEEEQTPSICSSTEEEEINVDAEFERVRQLVLNRKVDEAVTTSWNVCTKLKKIPNLKNLPYESKEECLFLFLLKTFMDSEGISNNNEKELAKNSESSNDYLKKEILARKNIVNYLSKCLHFATQLEIVLPMAEKLLFSTVPSDSIEACNLVGTAYQFGVTGADLAVREALLQIFHRDQTVRNNVAEVYKNIYLIGSDHQSSPRQKALTCVKALTDLTKGLEQGQSQALNQIIVSWYNNQDINNEVLQILWERFTLKSPEITALDSRIALLLITMISFAQSKIITSNLDTLVKVGLGPRAKTDLLLARDTCKALLQIKQEAESVDKTPVKYPNDHCIFKEIIALLKENFTIEKDNGYVSFAKEAISAIYHLANQPEELIKELLLYIFDCGRFNKKDSSEKTTVPFFLLQKLLFIIGHITIKQMVHLDTSVYKELKRRDIVRQLRKEKRSNKLRESLLKSRKLNVPATSSTSAVKLLRNKDTSIGTEEEDNGQEAVEGAAEDADAEFINDILEAHVVTGDGMLAKFVPLVLDVCQYPDKYNDESVQAAGVIALSKIMCVSSVVCEKSLQLLMTILERSEYPGIRSSVLLGISDLTTRFPNQLNPWMKHVYARLQDEDTNVRSTCVRVLSNLIMKEMVRVRGQVSELALCIVDKDPQIRHDVKEFFAHLSQKGNSLYNVIPDILSRLTDPDLQLDETHYREILRFIMDLLHKEPQVDAIIGKVCTRFILATTEREWRDFSYCLSILPFSIKSISRLSETLPLLKNKIQYSPVSRALQIVVEQAKKKQNTKAAALELEEKIQKLLEGAENSTEIADSQAMPPPPVPVSSIRKQRNESSSDVDEDDYLFVEFPKTPKAKPRKNSQRKSKSSKKKKTPHSDSDDEDKTYSTPKQDKTNSSKSSTKRPQNRKNILGSSPDSSTPVADTEASEQTSQRMTRSAQARRKRKNS